MSAACSAPPVNTPSLNDKPGDARQSVATGPTSRFERIRVLGFNDFHGNLTSTRKVNDRVVGGAAVLGAYLRRAALDVDGRALIVHAGDQVGASPPVSALLQDEPSIQFLNSLGNTHCTHEERDATRCNVVGTLGNHEFDEGKDELLRLIHGGDSPKGPFLQTPYRGAAFAYVCANVVDTRTRQPLLPPYVVRQVGDIRVGVIGAVVRSTPTIVTPTGVASLSFLDEAEAINAAVFELRQQGVRTIVVTIHQGGTQAPYVGPTSEAAFTEGDIIPIVARLDDEVDVVVSGHAHQFSNAFVRNQTGKPMLVTQAFSAGTAFAQIDLRVDVATGDVVHKQAQVVTTFADAIPEAELDLGVVALVAKAEAVVAPQVNRVVGHSARPLTRRPLSSGEAALGNVVADAQRWAAGTDFAVTNVGGIRADLAAGEITWGELFTIQPFGNSLVRIELTGAQLLELLEQQWRDPDVVRMLQISGFSYSWSAARPLGTKVLEVAVNGKPLDKQRVYTLVMNSFMADGGDRFEGGVMGVNRVTLGGDLEALVAFVQSQFERRQRAGQELGIDGRIVRVEE